MSSSREPISATIRVKKSNHVHKGELRKAFKESTHILVCHSSEKSKKLPNYKGEILQKKKLAEPGLKLAFFNDDELLLALIIKAPQQQIDSGEASIQLMRIKNLAGKQVSISISGEKIQICEVKT